MESATVVRSNLHSAGSTRLLLSAIPRATNANSPTAKERGSKEGREREREEMKVRKRERKGKESYNDVKWRGK